MMCRVMVAVAVTVLCAHTGAAQTPADQQMNDFSLAGYGDKGEKSWDLAGKTADIFDETVKLGDVVGNLYGEDTDIQLTADRGDFHRANGTVALQDNVTITTSTGAQLKTESLNWDRKEKLVSTRDAVTIKRDNIEVNAQGAAGSPSLRQVSLEKDVKFDINPMSRAGQPQVKTKTTITCDGPLEIDYEKNVATFKNNVAVQRPDSTIYSDALYIYFITRSGQEQDNDASVPEAGPEFTDSTIDRIVARGNVRVVRGDNVSYSEEAVYSQADRKIILRGRPKLVIVSTEALDAPSGD